MIDRLEWQIIKCFKLEEKIGELEDMLKQSQDEARDYRSLIVDIKELEPLHMDGHLHWKGMNTVIRDKCRNVLAKHTKTEKEGGNERLL